jgi:hypothetical protein
MIMETKRRREMWLDGKSEASNTREIELCWKKLWKVKVPSKLRMFAWRLARSSLPIGEERERRHMATSAVCPICCAAIDSWRHSLLDCNLAKVVWSLREDDLVLPLVADETTDAKLWLFSLSSTLRQEEFIEALVTLWAIWWARRKAIHEEEFQSPLSTHMFIAKYLADLQMVSRIPRGSMTPRMAGAPTWIPPPVGMIKANVDGAVARTQNKGVVEVVLRDELGVYRGASATIFDGVTDPTILEAYACREAISLAEDVHITEIRIALNCSTVVKELTEGGSRSQHCMVLKDIEAQRNQFQHLEFVHERHESNGEAHL